MKYSISILLALVAGSAVAAPRSLQQARELAQQVLTERLHISEVSLDHAVMQAPMRLSEEAEQPFTPYYIFNNDNEEAFVLISGSDLMPGVIGYGAGSQLPISKEEMPQSLRSWLQYVADLETYLEEHPTTASLLQTAQATTPVGPLLTTQWGQDSPYCDQCPTKYGQQTVTGCMATSISQVINHSKYPSTFTGTYSYNDNGTTRSLNFSNISIDYSLMADKYYRTNTTQAQKAEVAKLMYAVGIAIDMHYGTINEGGSGAITEQGVRGLTKNLGHTKAQALLRKRYTLDEWNEVIQYELRNNRPVVFDGHSSEGGHSFVLDGVNEEGLYHVNWGWDGLAEGFFDVSVLHPDQTGIGATDSADGFNQMQDVIVGIGDPNTITRWHSPIVVSDQSAFKCNKQTVSLGSSATFSASLFNSHPAGFKGYIGLVVMKDGEEYKVEEGANIVNIAATTLVSNASGTYSYQSYGSANISRTLTFPSDMPDGEYQIYLYARPDGSEQIDYIRQVQVRPSYWTAIVGNNRATLSCTQASLPLYPESWNFQTEQMSTQPSTVKATLSNIGSHSVACALYARFTRPDGKVLDDVPAKQVLTIAADEEKEAEFDVTFNLEGQWKVELLGQPIGLDVENLISICTERFNVAPHPTLGANFSVSKKLEVVTEHVYNVGPVDFNIQLNNTGAAYNGKIVVRLYTNKTSTASKYLQAEIENDLTFPALTTQDVTISGQLNLTKMQVAQTTLYARAFYLRGESMEQLTSTATNVAVFRKDEQGIETVTMDQPDPMDFSHAEVYDICGRRIQANGSLPRGIYIINGQKRIIK